MNISPASISLLSLLVVAVLAAPAEAQQPGPAGAAGERPTGTLLVVNKGEATLSLVDLSTEEEITRIGTGEGPHEVAASPDGQRAVVTNYGTQQSPGNTLTVIDLERRESIATIDLGEQTRPHGITWLPDERRVAVTTEGNGTLTVVDVATGRVETAIPTGQEVSHEVAVTPDGARAFVANIGSGSVTVIDLDAGRVLRQIETGAGAEGIDITPDGSEVWVSNRAANTVSVIDVESLEVVGEMRSEDFPIRVVLTPAGDRALVTNARSGELRIFDVASRRELAAVSIEPGDTRVTGRLLQFEGSAVPIGVQAVPGSRYAYVAAANADVVAVVDLNAYRVVRLIEVGTEPDGLDYFPAVAAVPDDRRVRKW